MLRRQCTQLPSPGGSDTCDRLPVHGTSNTLCGTRDEGALSHASTCRARGLLSRQSLKVVATLLRRDRVAVANQVSIPDVHLCEATLLSRAFVYHRRLQNMQEGPPIKISYDDTFHKSKRIGVADLTDNRNHE